MPDHRMSDDQLGTDVLWKALGVGAGLLFLRALAEQSRVNAALAKSIQDAVGRANAILSMHNTALKDIYAKIDVLSQEREDEPTQEERDARAREEEMRGDDA